MGKAVHSFNITVLMCPQAKTRRLRASLIFMQKKARRLAIPSDTSNKREHHSTQGFWQVDDPPHRPLVCMGPRSRTGD